MCGHLTDRLPTDGAGSPQGSGRFRYDFVTIRCDELCLERSIAATAMEFGINSEARHG